MWSNNIDSEFNVGVAATDDEAFFVWQDTRNAVGASDNEDIYASSIQLAAKGDNTRGASGWALVAAGALGLGLGIAWMFSRLADRSGGVRRGHRSHPRSASRSAWESTHRSSLAFFRLPR